MAIRWWRTVPQAAGPNTPQWRLCIYSLPHAFFFLRPAEALLLHALFGTQWLAGSDATGFSQNPKGRSSQTDSGCSTIRFRERTVMNTLRRSLQQLFSVCVVVGVFGWVGTPRAQAQATLPLYEPFDYPPGNLVGNSINGGTWAEVGSNNLGPVQVTAGSLSYPGLPSPRGGKVVLLNANSYEDPGLTFTNQTAGSVYTSFILNVVNPGNTTGDYVFCYTPPSTTNYYGRLYVKKGSADTKFILGLQQGTGTTAWTSAEYDVGTPILVVIAYDIISGSGNDTAELWINPQLGQPSPPAADLTASPYSTDITSVGRVCLRQGSNNTNLNVQVDELRVSTSWSDVALLPVTLSSWAVE
jgi:hypothetical protein